MLIGRAKIRKLGIALLISNIRCNGVELHVVETAEFCQLMQSSENIGQIESSIRHFHRSGHFTMFEAIKVSLVYQVSRKFASKSPSRREYHVAVQIRKIHAQNRV